MTVGELRARLEGLPDDMEVVVESFDHGCYESIDAFFAKVTPMHVSDNPDEWVVDNHWGRSCMECENEVPLVDMFFLGGF
jgi:hypothetical protein